MTNARSGELKDLRVALVGPGRVGTSLASWARARGAMVEWVAGRTAASAERVATAVGARAVAVGELESAGCDLLLVAVSDPSLDGVARELGRRPQARVALHTAGGRGASALAPLAASDRSGPHGEGETLPGTFHPLKAFPAPLPDPAGARGTFFALDGPAEAVALGRRLASAFGGTAEVVGEEDRPLYHLAASVAAGGVATLVASTAALARELGLPDAVGRGYLTLAAGALGRQRAAAESADREDRPTPDALAAAITGPVARGELETFGRQMARLAASGPSGRRRHALFADLARETVRLARPGATEAEREAALATLRRALEDPAFLDPPGAGC